MTGVQRDGDVRDGRVFRLAASVGNDGGVARAFRHFHGFHRLRQRADLIHFDENGIGDAFVDAAGEALRIRDEEIVADELNFAAERLRQKFPAVPIFFAEAVFDGNNRIIFEEALVIRDHARRVLGRVVAGQMIEAVIAQNFGRCDVERESNVFPGAIARFFNRFANDFNRRFVGRQIRRKAAFVADRRRESLAFEHALERLVHFGAHAERFAEIRSADGHDHAFLDVDIVVRVRAAVHDIHHRHGEHVRIGAAQILIQRKTRRLGRCLRRRERHRQNRIRAEAALIFRPVERNHEAVDAALIRCVHPNDGVRDFRIHIFHGREHALAAKARTPVAKLRRLIHAGGRPGRDRRARKCAVRELHIDLDRRVSSRIQNFSCANIHNVCHDVSPPLPFDKWK